ncbi:MAG: hypothetical protein AAFY29_11005 [Pseudomonadota bacterium]
MTTVNDKQNEFTTRRYPGGCPWVSPIDPSLVEGVAARTVGSAGLNGIIVVGRERGIGFGWTESRPALADMVINTNDGLMYQRRAAARKVHAGFERDSPIRGEDLMLDSRLFTSFTGIRKD